MATYNVARSKHATLVAATVDTVTVGASGRLLIINRGGGDIYFTLDGTTPVSGADNTYFLGDGDVHELDPETGTAARSVKLISSATASYSVEGLDAA